jgi:hypothetical protein
MEKHIGSFKAKYDRFGYIKIAEDCICDVCGADRQTCIVIDSSMDEYGPGKICKFCIDIAYHDLYK